MAVSLNKFVITATTTVPAGAFTLDATTGERVGTGSYAPTASAYGSVAATFIKGQVLLLDSGTPSALYTCLNGLGILRAYVQGQDDVGHAALAN